VEKQHDIVNYGPPFTVTRSRQCVAIPFGTTFRAVAQIRRQHRVCRGSLCDAGPVVRFVSNFVAPAPSLESGTPVKLGQCAFDLLVAMTERDYGTAHDPKETA